MKDITKKYSNGEITIVWKPQACIHSTICWKAATGLPEVFDPSERPWIKPEAASTEQLIAQIDKCPSGALSYFRNDKAQPPVETIAEVIENGPLLVYGNLTVKDKDGNQTPQHKLTAFCRCGASANKPYCDGSHTKVGFRG
jgi:uncharacterized Fe-S cluster protein YjdI